MSFVERARAGSTRNIRRAGGGATSTLRRKNTLLVNLTLAAGALSGALSVTAAAAGLAGRVAAGAKFQIAGVAGTYTVAADAAVSGGQIVLTLTVGLAGAAALGAALTWTQKYAEHSYLRAKGRTTEEDKGLVDSGTRVVHLAYDATKPAPKEGDELDGLPILQAETIGELARYRVVTGAAP